MPLALARRRDPSPVGSLLVTLVGTAVAMLVGFGVTEAFGTDDTDRDRVQLVGDDERRGIVHRPGQPLTAAPPPATDPTPTVPLLDLPPLPTLPPSTPGYDPDDRCPTQEQVRAATGLTSRRSAYRRQPLLLDAGPVRLRVTSCTYPEVASVHLAADPDGAALAAVHAAPASHPVLALPLGPDVLIVESNDAVDCREDCLVTVAELVAARTR